MPGIVDIRINNASPIEEASSIIADYGRNGDTYLAHVAEGELVIPKDVLSPEMKLMVYEQMMGSGLDLNRYTVGSGNNSINPETGNPEFFNPWKPIDKLVKGVKDVVKTVAPIALPILATFAFPLAPLFLTAGIGAFVGSKIGGASNKEALKAGIFSGALAGAGSALRGGNFSGSYANPNSGLGSLSKSGTYQPVNPFAGAAPTGPNIPGTDPGAGGGHPGIDGPIHAPAGSPNLPPVNPSSAPAQVAGGGADDKGLFSKYVYDPAANTQTVGPDGNVVTSGESYLESIFSPNRTSIQNNPNVKVAELGSKIDSINQNSVARGGRQLISESQKNEYLSNEALKSLTQEAPGLTTKYGPLGSALYGGVLLKDTLGGDVDDPRAGSYEYQETGDDLLRKERESGKFKYAFDNSKFYGDNPQYKATGGAVNGPGTGTSDSIPAMLSDGEFIMTAGAVVGAGGGDRKKGAREMYKLMRKFEERV